MQCNAATQMALPLKTPWRDGTSRPVLSPLTLIKPLIEWPLCGDQIDWF
jgi:hypothetical protein